MSKRPAIPVLVKEEILLEAGHRCAVCCETSSLEIAHIIPWRKSRKHRVEDLVCLCANCHTRADKDNWSERVFRRYKRSPCVFKRFLNADTMPPQTKRVTLTLNEKYEAWSPQRLKVMEAAVAAFLNIPPSHVRIVLIEEGSVKITFELPSEKADRLGEAILNHDGRLYTLLRTIHDIRIVELSGEEPEVVSILGKLPLWAWLVILFFLLLIGSFLGAWLYSFLETKPPVNAPLVPIPGPFVNVPVVSVFADNGWMIMCFLFSMFSITSGWGLTSAGLVRQKNVLSLLAQGLAIMIVVGLVWWSIGYSLIFSDGTPFLGGFANSFFKGVSNKSSLQYAPGASQTIFAMYQMIFAVLAPLIISGAVAERMKFSAVILFVGCWSLVVFCPIAHMCWGLDGLMNGLENPNAKIRAVDFAGGLVVHASSGWSALILCLIVGKRRGWGKERFSPHNLVLTMMGTGALWIGSLALNGGRAFAADEIAANAVTTTAIAAIVGSGCWAASEWISRGKPSVLGLCSGIISGVVMASASCGFLTVSGAIIVGISSGTVIPFVCTKVKGALGYDDALDSFGINAVGGTIGALLAGVLADGGTNPKLNSHLGNLVGHTLWVEQLAAIAMVLAISVIGSIIIALLIKGLIGLRVTEDAEEVGLDLSEHGEAGYSSE